MSRVLTCVAALVAVGVTGARAEGPAVDVVIGAGAPRLERRAAEELAGQLKTLFGTRATISDKVPKNAERLILVGSPETNPAVKDWTGGRWPKLSDQGHLLRSVTHQDRKALIVGGGSPLATLWAVYELGHHFGLRYLSRDDMPPSDPATLKLDGIDKILEPTFRTRAVQMMDAAPIGLEAWSLADQKHLLRQLAKLKFNRVILPLHPWQPFTPLEIAGARKKNAVLFSGKTFPLDGEAAGRTAFPSDARTFSNLDFGERTTLPDRTQAGQALVRGLINTAQECGLDVTLTVANEEFDQEYSAKLTPADIKKALAAFYPMAANVAVFEGKDLRGPVATWSRPGPGHGKAREGTRVCCLSVRQLAKDISLCSSALPDSDVVLLPLEGDGILPQLATQNVDNFLKRIREAGKAGYCVRFAVPADQDPCLHYLSRASCDDKITPRAAYEDYINAIWGEGVAERLIKGFDKVEEAVNLIDSSDPAFAELNDAAVMKHYRTKGPAPAWLAKARDLYSEAMDEMYRANQRARNVPHGPLFYHAKRVEFALTFLSSLEDLQRAAQARDQGKVKEQLESLEKATESMFNGLAAQGEISRDASNLGALAVLNEYGYRPLRAELERVEKVAKSK